MHRLPVSLLTSPVRVKERESVSVVAYLTMADVAPARQGIQLTGMPQFTNIQRFSARSVRKSWSAFHKT